MVLYLVEHFSSYVVSYLVSYFVSHFSSYFVSYSVSYFVEHSCSYLVAHCFSYWVSYLVSHFSSYWVSYLKQIGISARSSQILTRIWLNNSSTTCIQFLTFMTKKIQILRKNLLGLTLFIIFCFTLLVVFSFILGLAFGVVFSFALLVILCMALLIVFSFTFLKENKESKHILVEWMHQKLHYSNEARYYVFLIHIQKY